MEPCTTEVHLHELWKVEIYIFCSKTLEREGGREREGERERDRERGREGGREGGRERSIQTLSQYSLLYTTWVDQGLNAPYKA